MKKSQMEHLLKRYSYFMDSDLNEQKTVTVSISRRKEIIVVNSSLLKMLELFEKAYEAEKNQITKDIVELSIVEGNSDREVLRLLSRNISLGTYRILKQQFMDKVFCLCCCYGLVSENDILQE